MHTSKLNIIILFFGAIIALNCSGAKTVGFETPVDTKSKPIDTQLKRTYVLDNDAVFFSNEFDGARLNGLDKINDSTYKIIIQPENSPINNSAYYAFKVWADSAQDIYCTFSYPKGYKHRYIPKIKTGDTWNVLDKSNIFYNDSIVSVRLHATTKPQIIAAQEINSSKDVEKWYTQLILGKDDYVTLTDFGSTTLGRKLPVLNISKGSKKNKDLIVLLTRQHPPEVTGFYAFQQFLETILNDSELSHNFLSKYHVLAFPILNPDGVDLGHWRHNAGGVDTNRDWSEYNQPEVGQVVNYITKTIKKNKARLILGLDFHSTYEDVFYTNEIREGTTLPDFIDDWFSHLEKNIEGYKVNEKSSNSTKPVSKGWFLYGHDAVGITYEIGDATPKDKIQLIGRVSANEMMKILLNN